MVSSLAPLAARAWIGLIVVAVLAFAACAAGAVDCSVAKPVGLVAALAAAAVSLLDAPARPRQG